MNVVPPSYRFEERAINIEQATSINRLHGVTWIYFFNELMPVSHVTQPFRYRIFQIDLLQYSSSAVIYCSYKVRIPARLTSSFRSFYVHAVQLSLIVQHIVIDMHYTMRNVISCSFMEGCAKFCLTTGIACLPSSHLWTDPSWSNCSWATHMCMTLRA
jgi:hypothetical protein